MRSLFTVIAFTIKDMVKRKSFIISNLIILLIIVIGFNVPKFLSGITSEATKVTVLDNENIFEGRLDNLHDQFLELGYDVQIDKTSTRDQIQEKVKNKEISSAIILTETDSGLYFEYLIDGMGLGTTTPTEVINAIQLTYQNMQLSNLGIPEDQLPTLNMESNISVTSLSSDESSSNIFVMMLLSIVLFYAIYFYAYQVSSAITVEKNIKNYRNVSYINKSKDNSIRKNYWYRNSRNSTNISIDISSNILCKYIFTTRNSK